MKASELIEKLQKAIDKVGDTDVRGIGHEDDFLGGVSLTKIRHVAITNHGQIVISETSGHNDIFYSFEEIK